MVDMAVYKKRLKMIIQEKSLSTGTDVQLASGRSSSFYFNMKPTMMDPEGIMLISEMMLDVIGKTCEADYVGGLEMGAVPLVTAVAQTSFEYPRQLPAFFVRKAAKAHGTKKLVEGLAPGETLEGKTVVIVEDVCTTGESALQAVRLVEGQGAKVALVLTVVDREEGASETYLKAGITFKSLIRASEFSLEDEGV